MADPAHRREAEETHQQDPRIERRRLDVKLDARWLRDRWKPQAGYGSSLMSFGGAGSCDDLGPAE